uniref:ADP-ribosylation factor-like 13A n=1 Tax=Neogobius melanostomus TaxID=47308 RepID=A0A8C6WMB0_9GOBI
MFNLMSNCCTWVSKIQEPVRKLTILVVGLDKAGKTSSIRGMLRGEAGPTHGCVRYELRVENYLVTLLDVGGSAESRSRWRELYSEAHGIIFVVDSCDRQRMKEVNQVLEDLLKHPRVAGKPLLVLANKQDKINALLGSELIEILSLEKLVNQSRSLCHIEPCSALMDLRRWSDRKTLRGLRWLLRAVGLDYPDLCARVMHDSRRTLEQIDEEKNENIDKILVLKIQNTLCILLSIPTRTREKKTKGEGKLQPIRNMLQKVGKCCKLYLPCRRGLTYIVLYTGNFLKKEINKEEEKEPTDNKERARSVMISSKKSKLNRKDKSPEDKLAVPELPSNEEKPLKVKVEKRKKKKVGKVKRKNKINTEEMAHTYSQPVDLSSTFDLYRKAILALKERQEQGQG